MGILAKVKMAITLLPIFVSGMMKTVPPLNDLFNMAGLNLPTYLAKEGKQITNDEGRIANDEGKIKNDEKQKTNNA